jgi:hypothetical protein
MKRILVILVIVTLTFAAWYVGATNMTLRMDLTMKAPTAAPVSAGSNILTVGLDNIAAVGGDLLVTP